MNSADASKSSLLSIIWGNKPISEAQKFPVDENIQEVDVEYHVEDVQTEVEYEAEGVFFVSGYFRLVVDIPTHITDHVQPLRLRLPVRSSLVTLTDLFWHLRWGILR